MKNYIVQIKNTILFGGIDSGELEPVLKCLEAEVRHYEKGDIALRAGDAPRYVGVVLSGTMHITREDYDGNRSIVALADTGDIFAEALCCAGVVESPVTVTAGSASDVMLMPYARILNSCGNNCTYHSTLIRNMLAVMARKNLFLQNRMEIISRRSVRTKLTRYLEGFVPRHGKSFDIPLDRSELADYLCVERTALSHELSRMADEGLIEYQKNKFKLLY